MAQHPLTGLIHLFMKTESGLFPISGASQILTIASGASPSDLSPDGTYIAVEGVTLKNVRIYKQASLLFTLDHLIDIEPDHPTVADVLHVQFSHDNQNLVIGVENSDNSISLLLYSLSSGQYSFSHSFALTDTVLHKIRVSDSGAIFFSG